MKLPTSNVLQRPYPPPSAQDLPDPPVRVGHGHLGQHTSLPPRQVRERMAADERCSKRQCAAMATGHGGTHSSTPPRRQS